MNIENVRNEKTVFLIGAPRSGTTWLGKIFDSSPQVLYRHEPDTVLRDRELQRNFEPEDYPAFRERAGRYIDQLVGVRAVKSSGSLPVFRKDFQSARQHLVRKAMILSARGAAYAGSKLGALRKLEMPDFVDPAKADEITLVIKTISSRGRAGLFAHARPGSRFVVIIRDPFGQVASMLRGIRTGKFERTVKLLDCLGTEQARRYGMTRELFERLAPIEQHAWHWALLNEKAIDDLRGVPNTMLLRYRDLVTDPQMRVREAFAMAGISWHAQTEQFIGDSTSSNMPDRYYHVFKNSMDSLNKWRRQLTAEERDRIARSVSGTHLWRLYPEFHNLLA